LLTAAGCNPLECGEGTREEDDRCVPTTPVTGSDAGLHCGAGTIRVGNECVPSEDLCGEFTDPEPVLDDAGVPTGGFVCVGRDPGVEPPPECPEDNPPGTICLNGWVRWLLDDEGALLDTAVADPAAPADASAVLEVRVYDPLQYAGNPNVAPLAVAEYVPTTGAFRVTDVPVPATGFIALVVDDHPDAAGDDFAFAGIPFAAGTENLLGVTAVAIASDQVDDWTAAVGGDAALATIGCPEPAAGERTLATCGTWIGVFAEGTQDEPGAPIEGITPTESNGSPIPPESTFYLGYTTADGALFDEPAAGAVWSDGDGPHEWTGIYGTVLYPGASLGSYGGICAEGTPCEAGGCVFPQDQTGGAARGALFVQYVFSNNGCTVP